MDNPRIHQVRVKDLTEDTIETKWIPLWDQVSRAILSKDLAMILISLSMKDENDLQNLLNELIQKNDFATKLVHESMLKRFEVEMDVRTQLWLAVIFRSPGNTVMLFAYIKYKMFKLGITKLTFDDLNRKIFPMGYPTEEEMDWLWDCQKVICETREEMRSAPGTGNMLDIQSCYTSFFPL